ncbi:MAG TPA: hypothetical protein VHD58_08050 [Mycobacteriales bacterium]|nr:hypothetical protein [Mycobacteriales bacterium]
MIRPAVSVRRRLAVGTVVLGLATVAPLTSSLEAGAGTTPGSGLGAVNVHAEAVGLRIPFYSHQGENAEGELPYAVSDLGGGGIAHAVTSFFWPGPTGATLGSTIGVLSQGKAPSFLTNSLNDPFKAEAPTTQGGTKVSLSQPGFTMQALALPTHVNSSSALGLSQMSSLKNDSGPLVSATTDISFKGADTVVSDASTALTDISIGPLYIGSVVTAVHATSDGKHATGTSSTKVVDANIAGIGVRIDQQGVELANQSALPASVIKTLNKTVNSALATAGITVSVVPASKLASGPQISVQSGALLVTLAKAGYKSGVNDTGIVLQLGGASISANASPGYVAPVTPTTAPTTPTTTTAPSGGGPPSVQIPPSDGASVGTPTTNVPVPVVASKPLSLPGAISSWWIVAGVALAVLAALAMSLLPSRALAAAAASCRLEEES